MSEAKRAEESLVKSLVIAALDEKIAFQKKWKRVAMVSYMITTAGTILGATLATILGALDFSKAASFAAGTAMVLVSLEKSLLLREKWKFHLRILTQFESIRFGVETDFVALSDAVSRTQAIMEQYAIEVPITERDVSLIKETIP